MRRSRRLSADRRYGPRRLASLLSNDVEISAGAREHLDPGADAPTAARSAPACCSPRCRARRSDGAKFIPQAVEAGAAAILDGQQPLPGELSIPVIRVDDPRRALALAAARYLRAPAAHASPRSPAPTARPRSRVFLRQIWEQAGHKAASLGTIGLIAPGGAVDRQPDDARSDQAARDHGRPRRRRRHASRARGVEPRARAAAARRRALRGRRLHQPLARPSRLPSRRSTTT